MVVRGGRTHKRLCMCGRVERIIGFCKEQNERLRAGKYGREVDERKLRSN
jgi:hypothetical protein